VAWMLWGALGGIAATVVTAGVNRALDRTISKRTRRREAAVRDGTAHDLAAKAVGRWLAGGHPDAAKMTAGRALFSTAFGVGWG
jgi:hypothetical protein